jgi:cystathionine beta-lyase
VGKVWTREELAKIGELCKKHGVTVLSDEIHCDFVRPGMSYVPFASVNDVCADISVSCISASKTFNIAGLGAATVFAKDPLIRYRVFRGINNDEVGEPGAFSVPACLAAFRESDEWVSDLVEYVFENKRMAVEYINSDIPGLSAVLSDATYLLWIDISGVSCDSVKFCEDIRRETGLYLSDGEEYGECGRCFVRMNLATQRSRVIDGLERLKRGVETILKTPKK